MSSVPEINDVRYVLRGGPVSGLEIHRETFNHRELPIPHWDYQALDWVLIHGDWEHVDTYGPFVDRSAATAFMRSRSASSPASTEETT